MSIGFVPKSWTDNRKKKRAFAGHYLLQNDARLRMLIAS